MSGPAPVDPRADAAVQTRLRELARVLRHADHLGPDAQQSLADLVDELSNALTTASLPAGDSAHLAESATHLARAVQEGDDTSLWTAAQERLEQAALKAEASAPLPAGILRRILDALANLGI
jgi:hypothetical protein